jgi:hypothetical protein
MDKQKEQQQQEQVNAISNCVLLVDSRKSMTSVMSTRISLHNLKPNCWDLVILTSAKTKSFYKEWFPNAKFIEHPFLEGKFNIETYNRLMKDELVWSQIDDMKYKKCLVVQDDGLLTRPGVEDVFLEYDYVGAPWRPVPHLTAAGIGPAMVGNGGISLRSVKLMLEISRTFQDEKMYLFDNDIQPVPEDVYFASLIEKVGGRIPETNLASSFAMEQIVNTSAFGMHKPWPYVGTKVVIDYIRESARGLPPVCANPHGDCLRHKS